jgi:dihydroflavonol-4-reductase
MEICSVFDVVKIHLLAMTNPNAAGKRFLCCSGQVPIREVASILTGEFKQYGYKPSSTHVSDWVVRLAAHFDPVVRN